MRLLVPIRLRAVVFLAVMTCVLLTAVAATAAPRVAVDRAVPFGGAVDEQGRPTVLRMDVYHPQGPARFGARPAIVWIHGGGFVKGDRGLTEPYARAFARRGYVAVSIDYRLVTYADLAATGRPDHLRAAQHDAQAAVRYLRRHATALGIDRTRIFAAGTSAGAMTALSVALHPEDPGTSGNPGYSSRVRAAIAVAGFAPSDASFAGAPPMLLFHGTADRILPFGRAEETCRTAHADAARCDLVTVRGAGHRLIWDRRREIDVRAARWLRDLG